MNFKIDSSINVQEINNLIQSNESLKVLINNLFDIIQRQNVVIAKSRDTQLKYSDLFNKLVIKNLYLGEHYR